MKGSDPQMGRHVSTLFPTLGELEAASDAARDVIAHPGWEVMEAMLGAEVATIDALMDSGRILEHAEYAARHGRRSGLRAPTQALMAVIEHADAAFAEQRRKHEGDAEPSLGE